MSRKESITSTFAEIVRKKTRGGIDLIEFAVDTMTGKIKGMNGSDRIAAMKFLAERGYGKVAENLNIEGKIGVLDWVKAIHMKKSENIINAEATEVKPERIDGGAK